MDNESIREKMIRESNMRLFGRVFLTDDLVIEAALTPPHHMSAEAMQHGRQLRIEALDRKLPGFKEAVMTAMRDLDNRQIPVDLITYFFGEVKAWPHDSFWVMGPSKTVFWKLEEKTIQDLQ